MDNCDLEKLSVKGVCLCPSFKPEVTFYTATVPSDRTEVALELLPSDSGASCKILFGSGSKCLKLDEGLNPVEVEVTAEDGTVQKYRIELMKLSSTAAQLTELTTQPWLQLQPHFSPQLYEYSSTVSFDCCTVTVQPQVPDPNMKLVVNEGSSSDPVFLNVGDTVVTVTVVSPDGTYSQAYTITVTREQIPFAVTFCDVKDQMEFECSVSLNALYRPLSINPSDPKVVFSAPYIDLMTQRSKVHPFTGAPLGNAWKLPETELDNRISNTSVRCFFAHRGCGTTMKLAEIAAHAKGCSYKPPPNFDAKEVTETNWYKKYFLSAHNLEIETKHSVQIQNWEKRLQTAIDKDNIDDLCSHAQSQIKLYKEKLPKPGEMQNETGQSLLHCLEQASIHYATAIKFEPQNPKLHFLLGQTLEECYYAQEMYDLKKKTERDATDLGEAQASGMQEEIWAICKLHGFLGIPTLENQLKALDMEYHQLKEQGHSEKADYIQTLFSWLSKKARMDSKAEGSDEETSLHRALQKYLDAWSLSPDNWEFNLHVGRLLLLQEKSKEALQHLQTALALKPCHTALRFYTGLALLQQDGTSVEEEKEATLFLHQGLEYVMGQYFNSHDQDWEQEPEAGYSLSIVNAQFLRGCLSLGALLSKHTTVGQMMSPMLVYQNVAVMAAQALSVCVGQGQVTQQLERVLLDAHFTSLKVLTEREDIIKQAWTTKRCQALSALIRLSCIATSRELLDLQLKVCALGVMNTPCNSTALCLLGLAQLAQCDSDPGSETGQEALANACLSFQASIMLEGLPITGDPPEQLTKQKWWQEHLAKEKEIKEKQISTKEVKASRPSERTGAGRGIGKRAPVQGGTTATAKTSATTRGVKPARGVAAVKRDGKSAIKPDAKPQLSVIKSKQECSTQHTTPAAPVEEECKISGTTTPAALNLKSHTPRLGLARALARSPNSHQQACSLYQEVIAMSPQVHDAYIELANLLVESDPQAAVDVYSRFPLKPVNEQTFDDAFITGEIVHILMKQELYEHPQLAPNLIAYGKVMGLSCIEKYIDVLDGKYMTELLKTVYAGIHNKSVEDEDLQEFFKFKCWI
ncbi:uncharacterized protein LOC132889178 isoform X2 [Neoarius graeffei]|uniref:uncharacterized protein LOC132889178 isoform X2 n=1 Tax=Neoarius graeffei TaxID=443677 RepID=UPI00298D1661|nr:uncharacterized protein LOC132889178 isoform X2 [Neoarius graeffei]